MTIEEYHNALLAFIGDNPTPVQLARVDLACLLRQQLDEMSKDLPTELSGKIVNSLIRVLRELDGAQPRTRNFAPKLRPLFPSKLRRPEAAPKFVSKMRRAAE